MVRASGKDMGRDPINMSLGGTHTKKKKKRRR